MRTLWRRLLPVLLLLHQVSRVAGQLKGENIVGLAPDLAQLRPTIWSSDSARSGCELPAGSGHGSGVCVDDVAALRARLPFCGNAVQYRACVPAQQPLWLSWTASQKDAQLAQLFKAMVENRLAAEMNMTPDVYVEIHFLQNPDCIAQLKNVLCWYNFPKCDDSNTSLPLCTSSCKQYYLKCGYSDLLKMGSAGPCSQEQVAQYGLFNDNAPGPDQILAEDTSICRSTQAVVASLSDGGATGPWLLTVQGLAVAGLAGSLAIVLAAYLIVPYWMREVALAALWRGLVWPLETWKRLPRLQGRTLLLLLTLTVAGLTGYGLYRRIASSGGTFQRFTSPPPTDTGNASTGLVSASEATTGHFIPPESIYKERTSQSLTKGQLRQLIGSCTCTGRAGRRAGHDGAWAAAAVAAAATSAVAGRPQS